MGAARDAALARRGSLKHQAKRDIPSLEDPVPTTPLDRAFFARSADAVAPELLGHGLVRRTPDGWSGGWIIETEAYLPHDPASHSFRGQTARNAAMFGPPGHAYVYFIYGVHWCFNAVCGPVGSGEAVLVRAIAPAFGIGEMRRRRPGTGPLSEGPARLCQALDIDRRLDRADLCDADGLVFLARNPTRARWLAERGPLRTTPRIGLSKAVDWPLRFRA